MQSFAASTVPQSKRRKLKHDVERHHEGEASQGGPGEPEGDPDAVEEAEEEPEASIDDVLEDDVEEDTSDPFTAHFADPDDNELGQALKSIQQEDWKSQRTNIPELGIVFRSQPSFDATGPGPKIQPIFTPQGLKLKEKLLGVINKQKPTFDSLESHVGPLLFGYQDTLYCERTPNNAPSLRRLVCLHALNHIFK